MRRRIREAFGDTDGASPARRLVSPAGAAARASSRRSRLPKRSRRRCPRTRRALPTRGSTMPRTSRRSRSRRASPPIFPRRHARHPSPSARSRSPPTSRQPDPDIECVVTLQPVHPVSAGALAAGLHARLGKPLRWFGRNGADGAMAAPAVGHAGRVHRNRGVPAARRSRRRGEQGSDRRVLSRSLAVSPRRCPRPTFRPMPRREAARAEALDRLCADLDVQIGLTVLKTGAADDRRNAACAASPRRRGSSSATAAASTGSQDETGCRALHACELPVRAVHRGVAARHVDARRRVPARRSARGRSRPRLRPDEARGKADGANARRRASSTTTGARSTTRRSPRSASRCKPRRRRLREVNIEPGSPRALALFGG